jgi:thiol-disulfide isomerase/thioredoxin
MTPKRQTVLVASSLALAFLVFAAWVVGLRTRDMEMPLGMPEGVEIGTPLPMPGSKFAPPAGGSSGLPVLSDGMPEFAGIEAWLNSGPLSERDLRGKVVLIDFWTYSCINCIRTLPYVTSWHDAYADDGLVVIGVHTPEFAFEREEANVRKAIERHGIRYPVALDNGYATWNAYGNRYWPAKYLFDDRGRLRYFHFGEGKYDETEANIRALLQEAGMDGMADMAEVTGAATPDFRKIGTPETYLGYGRMDLLGSPEPVLRDEVQRYTAPDAPRLNRFYYDGAWRVEEERGVLAEAPGRIVFRYSAAAANLVMGPTNGPVRVEVRIDGELLKTISVDEEKLYELADFGSAYGEHLLELRFLDPGIAVYAFTFG